MPRLEDYEDLNQKSLLQRYKVPLLALGALAIGAVGYTALSGPSAAKLDFCPETVPVTPKFQGSLDKILHNAQFKNQSIEKLIGAVQIPTWVNDKNTNPQEDLSEWQWFYHFHDYLEEQFPLLHKHVKKEVVNEFGLLYTWEGSDSKLKPMMLMAHQDVVPVNNKTLHQWKYDPFSAHYDGEFIWGRGAFDTKNLLIAEMEAVEQLLHDGFKPKRTLLLSFGFDEEISGRFGAKLISQLLEHRYGKDGLYSIVDEGFGILPLEDGLIVAPAITGEKGYIDMTIDLYTPGGHSSVPPDHTGIGLMSKLISHMEDHPFKAQITDENPTYQFLKCMAQHSNTVSKEFKNTVAKSVKSESYKQKLLDQLPRPLRTLFTTTQAVDIINGGVKNNALPEFTSAVINHRIMVESSIKETMDAQLDKIIEIASKYDLGFIYANSTILEPTLNGYFNLTLGHTLEPAPNSPTTGPVWDIFSGTVADLFKNQVNKDEDTTVVVSPSLFSGNTDTRYMWNLTKNIYRFVAAVATQDTLSCVHSVNEHISADAHLTTLGFVYEYIVNVNENSK